MKNQQAPETLLQVPMDSQDGVTFSASSERRALVSESQLAHEIVDLLFTSKNKQQVVDFVGELTF